jgi:outer membrane protein OmpA-like peptidoglycan-associated protein
MLKRRLGPAAVLGVLLVSACASRSLVVVLPEPNGHVGAVVVHSGDSQTVLNMGYAAARPRARSAHPLAAGAYDNTRIKRIFGETLAAMPEPPVSQDLFFETDSLGLTPESAASLQAFLDTLKTRKAVEIVITGHTDTTGKDEYNDALSLQRAESIKTTLLPVLLKYGVNADSVTAVGRGKRELLVATPDDTPEPRNRRVEITVK